MGEPGAVGTEQVGDRARAVRKGHDLVMDSSSTEVLLDKASMAFIVFDHGDRNRLGHAVTSLIGRCHFLGNVTLNTAPRSGSLSTLIEPPRRRTNARA